jgi:hypothetical protein
MQLLTEIDADRLIVVRQADAARPPVRDAASRSRAKPLFRPVESPLAPAYAHGAANYWVDYDLQPLLPYEPSREGPPVAVADVDGDGLEDLFVGGSAGSPGRLYLQQADGRFLAALDPQPWAADSAHQDWGATFFDADGDGLQDLYVASGGYYLAPQSRLLQDRLYLNRGGGRFVRALDALPEMLTCSASVEAGDFNGDGRVDLFVGGRLTPGDYPTPTRSYVLRNDGGRFTDVTAEVAPDLIDPGGMVTAAVWMDFDADGALDLVTAGTWMPIRFYRNEGGRLREATGSLGLGEMRGWWYSLATGDLDGDGRPDLVAGNLGQNYSYTTSGESPFGVYAGDFSGDQVTEIVFTQEVDGTEYPYYGLALLGRDFDALRAAYPTFASFATESVRDIFGAARLRDAQHYQADTFSSVWLKNEGDGQFSAVDLPPIAQISPIRGIVIDDLDGDGRVDLLVAGNTLRTEPNTAPADAGKGLWMRGDGLGGFTPISPAASGFLAPHDVRDLALVRTPAGKLVVVANNGGTLQVFTVGR